MIVVRQVGKNLNRLELPEFASISRILDFFAVLVDAVFDVLDGLLSVSESDDVHDDGLDDSVLVDDRLNDLASLGCAIPHSDRSFSVLVCDGIEQSSLSSVVVFFPDRHIERNGVVVRLVLVQVVIVVVLLSDSLDALIDALLSVDAIVFLPLSVLASVHDCLVNPLYEFFALKIGVRASEREFLDLVPVAQNQSADIKILEMFVPFVQCFAITIEHCSNSVFTWLSVVFDAKLTF